MSTPDLGRPLVRGDIVELPDGSIATVAGTDLNGTVIIESPWSSTWTRHDPADLTVLWPADA